MKQAPEGAHAAGTPVQQGWSRRLADALTDHLVASTDRRALILLLLVLAVDYAERTLIGALGPTLESTFHFGNTTLGVLAAINGVVAALATLPLGWLTDRVKRTALLAISLLIFAGAVGVAGASAALAMFFGARLLLGAVSATSGPVLPSLTGDLVRARDRGRALGLVESGQLVGSGLGFLLAAVVASLLSWRWCFWLLAVAAAALAVGFWRTQEPERTGASGPSEEAVAGDADERGGNGRDEHDGRLVGGCGGATPERNPPFSPPSSRVGHNTGKDGSDDRQGEGDRIQQIVRELKIAPDRRAIERRDPSELSMWEAARYAVRVRTDLIVLVARAIGDFFFAAISTFGVVFATRQYGLSQAGADLAVLVLGAGAVVGILLVGRVGDLLLKRRHINGRLWLGALGYILAPAPLFFAFRTHAVALALPLFALGAFFLAGAGPPLDAVRVDVLVPQLRGRAEAFRQVLRTLAEGGAPLLFGLLSGVVAADETAGLRLIFLATLPVLVVSGLVMLLALRTYAPDVAAALASTEREAADSSEREPTGPPGRETSD